MTEKNCREIHRDMENSILKIIHLNQKAVNTRMEAMDKALGLKSQELERRLDELNHWKKEALDERSNLLNIEVYRTKIDQVDKDTRQIFEVLNKLQEHYNNRITIAMVIGSISLIVGIVIMIQKLWPH